MDMFNRAFLEVMLEGDAAGRVFTFPIPTYNITKDFDWDDPKLDLLFQVTAKYGIPYFSNFVNSNMNPEDTRSMCCRLRLDTTKLESRGGGLFGANPLTGSIGVVTLNLARIGYNSKSEEEFMEQLGQADGACKGEPGDKEEGAGEAHGRGPLPLHQVLPKGHKARFGEYWKNHFSTIGIVGMNEACVNLLGEKEGTFSEKGKEFALRVMDHMRERMAEYQKETGNNYNLEATPAESTCIQACEEGQGALQEHSLRQRGRHTRKRRRALLHQLHPSAGRTTPMTSSRRWTCRTNTRSSTQEAQWSTSSSGRRYPT